MSLTDGSLSDEEAIQQFQFIGVNIHSLPDEEAWKYLDEEIIGE